MSKRFFMSVSDEHGKFLGALTEKKGMSCIQDTVRELITSAYEKSQEGIKT